MWRPKLNENKIEANKEYLKRCHTKDEEKYEKADRERKQYERDRMKYLESKMRNNFNENEIGSEHMDKKKEAEKPETHLEEKPTSEVFGYKQTLHWKTEKPLPKSPRKKIEIIYKLATKSKLKIKLQEHRGCKRQVLWVKMESNFWSSF